MSFTTEMILLALTPFFIATFIAYFIARRRRRLFEELLFSMNDGHLGAQRLRAWLQKDPEVLRVLKALNNMYLIFDSNDCERAAFYMQQAYLLISNSRAFGLDHVVESEEGKQMVFLPVSTQ
jgi:hypothetical protein